MLAVMHRKLALQGRFAMTHSPENQDSNSSHVCPPASGSCHRVSLDQQRIRSYRQTEHQLTLSRVTIQIGSMGPAAAGAAAAASTGSVGGRSKAELPLVVEASCSNCTVSFMLNLTIPAIWEYPRWSWVSRPAMSLSTPFALHMQAQIHSICVASQTSSCV
jgi:hypothetical protein